MRGDGPIDDELAAIAARIVQLIQRPDDVRAPLANIAAPVMRALKWQPEVETRELSALIERCGMSEDEARIFSARALPEQRERAIDELAGNVSSVERAQVVYGRIPPAYAGWLERLWQITERAARVAERVDAAWDSRFLAQLSPHDWLPPLMARGNAEVVHVGSIDPLIKAAEREVADVGRRRRLLEAARSLLLDAGAALALDPVALTLRQQHVGRSIAQLDRYEAAGIRPGVALFHQLRQAVERKDAQRLHAALSALDEFALAAGDRELGTIAGRALERVWWREQRFGDASRLRSLERSGADTFDPAVHRALAEGYRRAVGDLPALRERVDKGEVEKLVLTAAEEYLSHDGVPITLRAALAVDGCFDVGGVLAPVRVQELERSRRQVQFPTANLVLAHARGPEDLAHAVIEDPRLVLLSLAAGRLLSRRYVADEVERRDRVVLRGEVRVYVLDGSGSMLGPRARMRDAILVAELSTLIRRLNDPLRKTRPVLYYRYFNHELEPVSRVAEQETALEAISEALSRVRVGGTDIEAALLASFDQVAAAQADDPDLARAQVVLVTDGEAPIDIARISRARETLGELPVGVSIIALGQENPALRELAAHQRARGERVFYQFIGDRELAAFVDGSGFGIPIHPPAESSPEELVAAVGELMGELEAYGRRQESRGAVTASEQEAGLAAVGLTPADLAEGERAHFEARSRDERALAQRVERWFGARPVSLSEEAPALAEPAFDPPPEDRQDLDLVCTLLASLVEVVDLVSSDALGRQADAIEVFERLLIDAGMLPSRYQELRRRYPAELAPALVALHAVLSR